jgi:hypothetical protein
MTVNLETTNILLGIMAAVSVLEALLLIAAGIMGYRLYNNLMATIRELDERRVAPLTAKVNTILDDVKELTLRVNEQAERVDHAVRGTIERVDETAERVKSSVRDKVDRFSGVLRVVRDAIEHVLTRNGSQRRPAPPAPPVM